MAPRKSSDIQILKDNKKVLILDAALKTFASHGYEGATISMITKEAGMSKGLLYTYYNSKEQLLDEIIDFGLKKAAVSLDKTPGGQITSKEIFSSNLRNIVQLFMEEADFWRLYSMLILQTKTSEKFQQKMKAFLEQYLGLYMTYFQQKNSKKPMAEALLFGAVLDGLMFDLMVMQGNYPVDEVIEMIIEKFA